MADLARILALPPPRSFLPGANSGGNQLRPIRSAHSDEAAANSLTIDSAGQAEDATAQAKRFRFRVYDGTGRSGEPADLRHNPGRDPAQATANQPRVTAPTGQAKAGDAAADPSEPKAIATFLAQLIAQERLGEGLHAPPVKAADLAYRRAGAEPSLDIGSPARFSLAV